MSCNATVGIAGRQAECRLRTITPTFHRFHNREVTPAYMRLQIANFCSNVKETAKKWKFTN